MAEIEETEDSPEAPEPPAPPGVVLYVVRSVIRGRSNRTARAMQAGRRGFVQRFAGGFIVRRARPARITEAVLKANLEEIKKAVRELRVEVVTPSGQLVDLDTFSVAPPVADKPLPNPPLDSAKNDKNANIGYKVPPNPTGTPLDAEVPELLQRGSLLVEEEELEVEPDPPTQQQLVPTSGEVTSGFTPPSTPAPPKPVQKGHPGKGKRGSP